MCISMPKPLLNSGLCNNTKSHIPWKSYASPSHNLKWGSPLAPEAEYFVLSDVGFSISVTGTVGAAVVFLLVGMLLVLL